MRRFAVNFVTLLSLLLCVSAAALGVRSYWVGDHFQWWLTEVQGSVATTDVRTVTSCVGVLWVAWQVELAPLPTATDQVPAEAHEHMRRPGRPWRVRHLHGPGEKFSPSFETHLGFGLYRHRQGEATDTTVIRTTAVSVPWGALAGAAAVFPAFRFRERLKRRRGFKRAARGQCVRCGYDVRASRESGRCPECGKALVSQ